MKDKLWFYAGFAPQMNFNARTKYYQSRTLCNPSAPGRCVGAFQQDVNGQYVMTPVAGTEIGYGSGFDRYFAIAKLTWLINENHNVFASFNTQPTTTYGIASSTYRGDAERLLAPDLHQLDQRRPELHRQVPRQAPAPRGQGWLVRRPDHHHRGGHERREQPGDRQHPLEHQPGAGELRPRVHLSALQPRRLQRDPVPHRRRRATTRTRRPTGTRAPPPSPASSTWPGSTSSRAGVQIDYSTYDNNRYYTGGAAIRANGLTTSTSTAASTGGNSFQLFRAYGVFDPASPRSATTAYNVCARLDANGNCVNPGLKDPTDPGVSTASTNTWSNGYFLQDSWTIANVLTLNFGVRLDTQNMTSPTATAVDATAPVLDISDMWAPRVQAIWDFTGTGRGKIQGNWGMYYESIPLQMALRALRRREPGHRPLPARYLHQQGPADQPGHQSHEGLPQPVRRRHRPGARTEHRRPLGHRNRLRRGVAGLLADRA